MPTPDESETNLRCTICGYVLDGTKTPPAHCPECGARATMFTPTSEPPHGVPHNPFQPRDHENFGDTIGPHAGPGDSGCMETD